MLSLNIGIFLFNDWLELFATCIWICFLAIRLISCKDVCSNCYSGIISLQHKGAPRVNRTDPVLRKAAAEKNQPVQPLLVEVIAFPYPDFDWKRKDNGIDIALPKSGFDVENSDLTSTLTIRSLTLENLGNYNLTATNKHGSTSVIFEISLQGRYAINN